MKWIEVTTQKQLDALKPGEGAIVRSGHFTAYGSATVRASGSATVTASKYVAVHHLSEHATVKGGVIIRPKTDTPQEWCEFYGGGAQPGHGGAVQGGR